jgi:adenylate kinase
MRVVLLGPPGVGKGTQASRLAVRFSVPHISTGEMLRDAIRRRTPAGLAAEAEVAAGRLVPDELVGRIVGERIGTDDCRNGFFLDGYPRNLAQAGTLERLLAGAGHALDGAVELTAGEDLLVRRLSGRRTCKGCGTVFHVDLNRPAREGRCDACGEPLVQRNDDREEVIRERLRVYRDVTAPLAAYYRERGLLQTVSAEGSVDGVTEAITQLLGAGRC